MGKIKQKDTKPEVLVRSLLHRLGFRFRKNVNDLPGKPDILLPKYKTVIFINGCYWHRHDCPRGRSVPTNNQARWVEKFRANQARDAANQRQLTELGYRIITLWTCELKKSTLADRIAALAENIRSNDRC